MRKLIFVGVVAGVLVFCPNAFAVVITINTSAAAPQAVSTGDTVTVTGSGNLHTSGNSDSNHGISGAAADNVSVTVQNGGIIEVSGYSGGKAIYLRDNATINVNTGGQVLNDGTDPTGNGGLNGNAIYAGANAAITVDGTVITYRYTGSSGLYNNYSQGIQAGSGSTVTVTGTVEATTFEGDAIRLSSGGTVVNSGSLISTLLSSKGFAVVDIQSANSTITNSGTIQANSSSLEAVIFGTGGTSSGNVLNLHGNSAVTGSLRNNGAAGGATINFGYTGSGADAAANTTLTGNIGADGNAWNAEVWDGANSVSGTAAFNNLQVDASSALTLGGASTAAGTTTINGTLTAQSTVATTGFTVGSGGNFVIGNNTVTNTGIATLSSGSTLSLTANSASDFGKIVSSGNNSVNAGNTLSVTIGGFVANNSVLKVIDGAGGAGVNVPGTITSSNSLVSFIGSVANGDLFLTAARTGMGLFVNRATTPNGSFAGAVLDSILNPSGDMLDALTALGNLGSEQTAKALDSLNPNLSASHSSFLATSEMLAVYTAHLNETQSGISTGETGFSFGEKGMEKTFWIKGFGSYLDQDLRQGIEGYTAATGGMIAGLDWLATDSLRIGLGSGWAHTAIDNKVDAGNTLVDNYQGSLYGTYQPASAPYFIDGVLSFGWNRYDGTRVISLGSSSRDTDATYDGQQYSALLSGGWNVEIGGGSTLTPLASLEYSRLHIGKYTEDGAGALDLTVQSQDYDLLRSGLGLKLTHPVAFKPGKLFPEIHGKWLYDLVTDQAQTTSAFTGGGASFSSNGITPDRNGFDMGAGVTFLSLSSWSLIANYDFEIREDFMSHSGSLTAKFAF